MGSHVPRTAATGCRFFSERSTRASFFSSSAAQQEKNDFLFSVGAELMTQILNKIYYPDNKYKARGEVAAESVYTSVCLGYLLRV
jgi:hypothetical protein